MRLWPCIAFYARTDERIQKDRKDVKTDQVGIKSRPKSKELWIERGAPGPRLRRVSLCIGQVEYNLLFRWFVGLNMDDPVWDVTVFTKNRQRFLQADIATKFFRRVVEQARSLDLMSDEHFTVDGTLLEACAGLKSFKRKDGEEQAPPDDPGNPTINFHGEKRSNETHESTTDPDSMLARKGKAKRPS